MRTIDREPTQRVLGWDFLRGMCALAVSTYHLLYWQKLADLHVWGYYGVYLFFILSGASLAYTYADRIESRNFSFKGFLWVRYLRLAPLYIALMVLVLPWKLLKDGATLGVLGMYLSNSTFTFGFFNPSLHAVLVGGWSLGIEAIYYLVFPLVLMSFRSRLLAWATFLGLLALQLGWIYATLGATLITPNWALYHQAPAFAAYFMGGCMIGFAHRKKRFENYRHEGMVLVAMAASFVLMLALNSSVPGEALVGWRGLLLCALCFWLVHAASRVNLTRSMSSVAGHLGDATYGLYLLHPVVFFGLAFVILPKLGISGPETWPVAGRIALAVAVIVIAFALAILSERFFERPLREWSKRRLMQRSPLAVAS